jgi:hypothetical protein
VPLKRDRATRRAKLDADTAKLLELWARLAPNVRARYPVGYPATVGHRLLGASSSRWHEGKRVCNMRTIVRYIVVLAFLVFAIATMYLISRDSIHYQAPGAPPNVRGEYKR